MHADHRLQKPQAISHPKQKYFTIKIQYDFQRLLHQKTSIRNIQAIKYDVFPSQLIIGTVSLILKSSNPKVIENNYRQIAFI